MKLPLRVVEPILSVGGPERRKFDTDGGQEELLIGTKRRLFFGIRHLHAERAVLCPRDALQVQVQPWADVQELKYPEKEKILSEKRS